MTSHIALSASSGRSRAQLEDHPPSLRPLEYQLQRHAGLRAWISELQFLLGNGGDDPARIGRSDEIGKCARLNLCMDRFGALVDSVRSSVGNCARRDSHRLLGGATRRVA